MATLSMIAEPFPDWEAPAHFAAARDLAQAISDTAPRGCSLRFLIGRGTTPPEFNSPRVAVEQLPMNAGALPLFWQSGATARPLDGEMTHAVSPMMPLRSRNEDDGTQSTLTVPHTLAIESPELYSGPQGRLLRAFLKQAARHADCIITHTHTAANLLQNRYGIDLPVQVIPPAAPTPFLAANDSAARRAALGLPERYIVTTAYDDEAGRLQWVYQALQTDRTLPHLVVLTGLDPAIVSKKAPATAELAHRLPVELTGRVTFVSSDDLSNVGAVISGATLLAQPQSFAATGYAIIAALMSRVPVLHAGTEPYNEYVLDAGIAEPETLGFVTALSRLFIPSPGDGTSELERLTVFAADRGRAFSWQAVGWQMWETHAAI